MANIPQQCAAGAIPSYLTKRTDANLSNSTLPGRAPSEYSEQFGRLTYQLAALEELVSTIVDRLASVTTATPVQETNKGVTASAYSQIGQDISSVAYRVETVNDALRRQIDTLAI